MEYIYHVNSLKKRAEENPELRYKYRESLKSPNTKNKVNFALTHQ
ncbi:conserved hypothetical protein [Xenorhabdus nematophila F1]|uniref:Uncharacterized protein n=1 Tax=Xenorhabdus nematophila (strain ATCC 19061 / DSM 3370 / CCUG 14189 / LMG 1036 / NCIMB 9965 / AN6) TaxID=406817 RepID=D3VKE4_XENNA|nr:hypothetical protein XNC1_0825 [Xenorhabdus nematophila ATCC 19061]CCW30764.1 conserved hypothetical protein [Xenorhabdus nematophila F1]CEE94590.1 hypothetical protein XNA1_4730016 [Xenorhabdus nematophila str. Anatoliense]CEF30433.1 hypothetical protein XNW1_2490016 [Xenorhabdus nematophila str. Websteri]CEK21806.1 hypothetical protein XNC2_0810 [Xenorhabdus nematophila AN6/1]